MATPNTKLKPPTPGQIAMYGHVTAALRGWLKQTNRSVGDLNEALGLQRSNPGAYHWVGGKGAPGPANRARLVKLTGLPEAALTARKPGQKALPGPAPGAPVAKMLQQLQRPQDRPVHSAPRQGDVLAFTVGQDGSARIRLDATLPVATAMPLLRMLLDAGIVFSPAEVGAE